MIYIIDNGGIFFEGTGDTLHNAIVNSITKLGASQFTGLADAKSWCIRYVRNEVSKQKQAILSASANYEYVELNEMMMEARDYKISGVTTAARYPLAQALATARSTTTIAVLTTWGNALTTAFTSLAVLIDRQDKAETAINNAVSLVALRDVMVTILEELAG